MTDESGSDDLNEFSPKTDKSQSNYSQSKSQQVEIHK